MLDPATLEALEAQTGRRRDPASRQLDSTSAIGCSLQGHRAALQKAVELLRPKYPAAAALVEQAEEDVLASMSFPQKHWRQIH